MDIDYAVCILIGFFDRFITLIEQYIVVKNR